MTQPLKIAVTAALSFTWLALLGSQASASIVVGVEPNNSIAMAQNIDAYFSLDFSPDIGNTTTNTSTTIPHVTVDPTNAAGGSVSDYYSFTVASAGSRGIFDIDYGQIEAGGGFESQIELYAANGVFLAYNDNSSTSNGQGGSVNADDSYLEYVFGTTGTYVIAVTGNGDGYELQVSIENHSVHGAVPEPLSLLVWVGLASVAGLVKYRRGRRPLSDALGQLP